MTSRRLLCIGLTLSLLSTTTTTTAQDRELNLSWLGSAGGRWVGQAASDQAGRTLARAGDLNGDGLDDFVVSAWREGFLDPPGRAYVVFGVAAGTGLPASASLSSADVLLLGGQSGDSTGQGLAALGDVNGDGFDDLLVGAPRYDVPGRTDSGRAYLVYGSASLPATITLPGMTPTQGVIFDGAATGNLAGVSVAGPGDLNGDGLADLVIGAQGASPLGRSLAGQVHVVYGRTDFAANPDLGTITDVLLQGAVAGDGLGTAVSRAGDVDGDGFHDVLAGAPRADPGGKTNAGRVYLLDGGATLPATVDTAAFGSAGTVFLGQAGGQQVGEALSGGGDVNGDGRPDLLFGSDTADPPSGSNAGRSFLVYGSASLPATLDLAALGAGGVMIDGAAAEDDSGVAVALDGDANGDGRADILIGAQSADGGGNASGQTYLVYGAAGLPNSLSLGALGARGVQINGQAAGDRCGGQVAFVGDVDGDGLVDIGLGSRLSDAAATDAGAVHVVEGACHLLLAEGSMAEGDTFTMKAFGPSSALFLLWISPGALPTPFATNKGNWWLSTPVEIGVLGFDADGQAQLPITIPTGLGLSGLTGYWQFLAQPQGKHCDLSGLLATTVE